MIFLNIPDQTTSLIQTYPDLLEFDGRIFQELPFPLDNPWFPLEIPPSKSTPIEGSPSGPWSPGRFTRRAGSNRWGFNGNTHSGHRLIQVIVFYMITHIRFSGWLFEICVFVHPIWDDD
jgi:hypothetical protein